MNLRYVWSDGTDPDFIRFSKCLEEYFNRLVGGEENRKSFLPHNALDEIHDVLLVYDGAKAVACASFRKYDRRAAEIKRVFVREEYRGNGISKIMLQKLESAAENKGYTTFILQTREACTEAVGLYESMGYRKTEKYPPYVGMPLAVCYAKKLL